MSFVEDRILAAIVTILLLFAFYVIYESDKIDERTKSDVKSNCVETNLYILDRFSKKLVVYDCKEKQ